MSHPTIETPQIPNDIEVFKHVVEFHSPGTFISETSQKEIPEWDVNIAIEMAGRIVERHGARPFGFRFLTFGRKKGALDSTQIAHSNFFFLGGRIRTREEVERDNLPGEEILRDNMRINNISAILENNNSYKSVRPLDDGDVVLDVDFSQIKKERVS